MRISFFILLLIPVLFAACSSEEEAHKARIGSAQVEMPIETGKDVEIVYTDSGLPKARLKAPLLERYTISKNVTEMKQGIHVVFLTKEQQVESFLTANYAIRYDKLKKTTVRNNVVVLNVEGDTLKTEEMLWDETLNKVSSDKFVTITTKDQIIMGDGFESDVSFKNPKVFKVRGIVDLK